MRPVEAWQVHLRVAGTAEGGRRAVALAPVIDAADGPLIATGGGGYIAAESFARAVARLAPAARLALREHADGRADIGIAVRIPSVALAEATGWLVVRGRGRAAGPLRKVIWNPAHHPRHPAGSPDSTGGEFAPVHGGGGRGSGGGQRASAGGPRDSRNPGRPAGRVADENRHHLTSAEYRVLGDLEAAIERTRSELYVPAGGRGRRPPGDAPQDGLRDALEILENSRGLVGVGAKAIRLLADAYPEVKAYLAPPRTLGEMRRTEEFKSFDSFDSYKRDMGPAKPGYELHHCVAQSSGFAPKLIHTTRNILEIPYWRHIRISAYYSKKQAALGNLSPREWLKGRSFDEHEEFCWKTLRRFGALL